MRHDLLFFLVTVSTLLGLTITMLVLPLIRIWKRQTDCCHAIAVYRDQLSEIESDFSNGMSTAEYTESRRTEIQRRMLRAVCSVSDDQKPTFKGYKPKYRVLLSFIMSLVMTVGAVGLYMNLGAPSLRDRPAAAEVSTIVQKNAARLYDELTQYMREHSDRVEGWILLARFERHLALYAAAAQSFRMAIERGVDDTAILASYGEMLVAESGGHVTSEACTAFLRAHHNAHNAGMANEDPRAVFYIGLAAFQEGELHCAISIWRGLEMHAPPGVPWLDMLRTHIGTAVAQAKITGSMPQQLWDTTLCGICAITPNAHGGGNAPLHRTQEH